MIKSIGCNSPEPMALAFKADGELVPCRRTEALWIEICQQIHRICQRSESKQMIRYEILCEIW